MKTESVTFFTEREEEFANLLIRLGTRKNIAMVLVYLANLPEVTSRQIERGTDLRQPEVSLALRYLITRNWIACREMVSPARGRPHKIYNLDKPFSAIIESIQEEKRQEANLKIRLAKKLREYVC
jgi:predicted transcriptional regulator